MLGWAVGEPLRTLVEAFGADVLLGAVGLFGALLITQASLRTMAQRTGHAAQRTAAGSARWPRRSGGRPGRHCVTCPR